VPTALTDDQVRSYHELGFVAVEAFVDAPWIERLNAVTDEFVEASRSVVAPNLSFDLEPDHSGAAPRLRRLNSPVDHHATYWEFASQSVIVDAVCDLIGPDVKFHHSKLNFKAPLGGEEVKWHQDIGFWPHTNYSPLTVGVFLADVEAGMGEVGFVPGSHDGDLFDQYEGDHWRGAIGDRDLGRVAIDTAVFPTGPAGTITIHNCRTVHGSAPNASARSRPLLLNTYTSADAFAYTDLVRGSAHGEEIIRGAPARWARHDPRPCQVGPTRYRSIFQVQQAE
jgi:ectoine hydroxylase-related dioxygenase (phytanoyl-CoA dioxygenase family)